MGFVKLIGQMAKKVTMDFIRMVFGIVYGLIMIIQKNNSDTTDSTISEQYRYKNGKLFLISAWDKQGKQNVINGNGILIDNHYSLKITTYLNGMKDGRQIVMKNDGNIIV